MELKNTLHQEIYSYICNNYSRESYETNCNEKDLVEGYLKHKTKLNTAEQEDVIKEYLSSQYEYDFKYQTNLEYGKSHYNEWNQRARIESITFDEIKTEVEKNPSIYIFLNDQLRENEEICRIAYSKDKNLERYFPLAIREKVCVPDKAIEEQVAAYSKEIHTPYSFIITDQWKSLNSCKVIFSDGNIKEYTGKECGAEFALMNQSQIKNAINEHLENQEKTIIRDLLNAGIEPTKEAVKDIMELSDKKSSKENNTDKNMSMPYGTAIWGGEVRDILPNGSRYYMGER